MLEDGSKLVIPTANPRAKSWDILPPAFRVWWKQSFISSLLANHHDEIIPATDNHGAWVLGAQPGNYSIRLLKHEHPNANNLQIINMLTDRERARRNIPTELGWGTSQMTDIKWPDHGCLRQDTKHLGQIETAEEMLGYQNGLHSEFNRVDTVCYCHCMAGVARSLTETAVFLYTYIYFPVESDVRTPDQRAKALFDFEHGNWEKIAKNIPSDLKDRLQDKPTFSDLIEYVRLQRPTAKSLATVEGDQAGLMGLIALTNLDNDWRVLNGDSFDKHISELGLMLKAPLDLAFRMPADIEKQKEKLARVYAALGVVNNDLLLDMLPKPKIGFWARLFGRTPEDNFDNRFKHLPPREQAHLAILMEYLREEAEKAAQIATTTTTAFQNSLSERINSSHRYAIEASKQSKKLTAGDQVALLQAFGAHPEILRNLGGYSAVAQKIIDGSTIDRYNAGIQLAELYIVASKNHPADTNFIESILRSDKLPYV